MLLGLGACWTLFRGDLLNPLGILVPEYDAAKLLEPDAVSDTDPGRTLFMDKLPVDR